MTATHLQKVYIVMILVNTSFLLVLNKDWCPRFPLCCPNKYKVRGVPHEDMKAHREECLVEMVQCDYHYVGCEE